MASHTVAVDILFTGPAETYFTRADRRVMIGMRATLELLGLPVPDYALRRKGGVTPARAVQAAFAADYPPALSTELAPRKPNASLDAVAAAKLRNALN